MNKQELIQELTIDIERKQDTLDQECKKQNPSQNFISVLASSIASQTKRLAKLYNAPGS